jgi:hypothetical protein
MGDVEDQDEVAHDGEGGERDVHVEVEVSAKRKGFYGCDEGCDEDFYDVSKLAQRVSLSP